MGDGALVYFGYPQAHEDDSERAVRAGLAAVEAIAGLTLPNGRAAQVRIGIATGLVVVGDIIGTGKTPEEDVVGETPNLAARLQAIAEPNGIVIATSTRRLLGNFSSVVILAPLKSKGSTSRCRRGKYFASSGASRFEALHAVTSTRLSAARKRLVAAPSLAAGVAGEGRWCCFQASQASGNPALSPPFRK